jgi:pimeloyl-ACP methyl ester carboxylesterase
MAQSQVLNLAANFKARITQAAWRTKPSWMLVAAADRTINPELERWYAERAKSKQIEVAPGGCHAVYVSQDSPTGQGAAAHTFLLQKACR